MMFWMDSKTLEKFLNNERYEDILNAEYVIVSDRIYLKDRTRNNIINARNIIFPTTETLNSPSGEEIRENYFKQLDGEKPFMAYLITRSILSDINIIFICTKKEGKLKILNDFADYCYLTFGYPIYSYKEYMYGVKMLKYNKDKVINICADIISEAERKASKTGGLSKKDLKKYLKTFHIDTTGMDKKELYETYKIIEGIE